MAHDDVDDLLNIIENTEPDKDGDKPISFEQVFIEKNMRPGNKFLSKTVIREYFKYLHPDHSVDMLFLWLNRSGFKTVRKKIFGFLVDDYTYKFFMDGATRTLGERRYGTRSKKEKE